MTYPEEPVRRVTEGERQAFRRDGAVILRRVIQPAWIERMREAVDRVLAAPGPAAVEYTEAGASGRYLGDFFTWLRDPDFKAFALASPLPALAQQLMQSREVTFFYDQLLVKEPRTREETPWHQDLPYWPLRGADILSLWVAFDPVTAESGAMRYVGGSHLPGRLYAPTAFGNRSGFADILAKGALPPFPPMSEEIAGADLIVCAVEPGDVVVHHPLTFHWSPGNLSVDARRRALALRYVGDDAVFDARPGTFLDNPRVRALLPDPIAYSDGERLGGANFPRVWPREASD
ncbi:MAG: phytanoyl-CoA dioxygenase [Caulobacter sp.]|nr:phytanoyl-CoA dioxygenase [Caulobacter sp.]